MQENIEYNVLENIDDLTNEIRYYIDVLKLATEGDRENICSCLVNFFILKIEENINKIREIF